VDSKLKTILNGKRMRKFKYSERIIAFKLFDEVIKAGCKKEDILIYIKNNHRFFSNSMVYEMLDHYKI
jgi:hypothetical protein